MLLNDRRRRWQFLPADDADNTDNRIVPDGAVLRSDGTITVPSGHRVQVPLMMMDNVPADPAAARAAAQEREQKLLAIQALMIEAERKARDPATARGAFIERQANAWKSSGGRDD